MVEEVHNTADRDYQRYSQLLSLWSLENGIKTQKLQYFLLTSALLSIGYALAPQGAKGDSLICIVGAVLSVIWTLSLGRTVFFQKRWQAQLAELATKYVTDSRFQILTAKPGTDNVALLIRLTGAVSSKYYLIGGPLAGIVFWLALWIKQ